jgi:hypothetical protein
MESKKTALLWCLLFILHSFNFAQVEVSGQIQFDATWTKDLSPYLIVGDVQVPAGLTLTIEPGVEVQYSGAYEILVHSGQHCIYEFNSRGVIGRCHAQV